MAVPEVSVIIPTRNSAAMLPRCLQSLSRELASFGRPAEVIGVDFNSDDGTVRLLESEPWIRVLKAERPGIAVGQNLGVGAARGPFVLFLNSDDELSEGFLGIMYQLALRKSPERHVVYCSVEFIDSAGRTLYVRRPAPYVGAIQRYYSIILHPNALYPLSLLQKHPFEERVDGRPTDREQVYALMKEAVWTRTREAAYRFRIWRQSTSVRRSVVRETSPLIPDRLVGAIGRIFVQTYETKVWERVREGRIGERSHWRRPG